MFPTSEDDGLKHMALDPNFELWRGATQFGGEIERLDPKHQFFYHLGFAINRWAAVDRELFEIFRALHDHGLEQNAAVAFFKSSSLNSRFERVAKLAKKLPDKEQSAAWAHITQLFNDNISLRNRLAHDPATVVVSGAISFTKTTVTTTPAVPPPEWQLDVEAAKVLGIKPDDTEPVKMGRIVAHIDEVAKLHSALGTFRRTLDAGTR